MTGERTQMIPVSESNGRGRDGSMYERKGWKVDLGLRSGTKVCWKREGMDVQGKSLLWFIYSDGRNTEIPTQLAFTTAKK